MGGQWHSTCTSAWASNGAPARRRSRRPTEALPNSSTPIGTRTIRKRRSGSREVTAAYDMLSDKDKRARYDRGEIDEEGNPKMPFGGGFGGYSSGERGPQGGAGVREFQLRWRGGRRPWRPVRGLVRRSVWRTLRRTLRRLSPTRSGGPEGSRCGLSIESPVRGCRRTQTPADHARGRQDH